MIFLVDRLIQFHSIFVPSIIRERGCTITNISRGEMAVIQPPPPLFQYIFVSSSFSTSTSKV
ncbi:hypothetical protein [Capnocytophaga gingivalis]